MSQVGFNFQGDVFTGGSLVLNTTGRLLKALSDGNVDVLAVAASLELGKSVPITRTQEMIVARSIKKRNVTRSGVLAKALSVGWGQSDIAYELSRTHAGCATMLLINALAVGVSSYKAAEGLQELLVLNGCTPEVLPTVDSLNSLINYITPIMMDSGFHAIMENTHRAIVVEMKKTISVTELDKLQQEIMRDSVQMKEWVDSIRQLCWAASREESLCIRINGRVGWLATFAVHVLGMGCKVACAGSTLWEAPGSRGELIVQFGPPAALSDSTSLVKMLQISLAQPGNADESPRIRGTYLLKDALRAEIEKAPSTAPSFYRTFCLCFARYLTYQTFPTNNKGHRLIISRDQQFPGVRRVFRNLGIELDREMEGAMFLAFSVGDELIQDKGKEREFLKSIQQSIDSLGEGRKFALDLLQTMTTLGMSLMCCHLSCDDLSIPTLSVGYRISLTGGREPLYEMGLLDLSFLPLGPAYIWSTLCDFLFFDVYKDRYNRWDKLIKSADGITLSLRMLFEEEAFNGTSQIFGIYPGQLSYGGIKRQQAIMSYNDDRIVGSPRCVGWGLAPGTTFKTPYTLPLVRIVDVKTAVEVREALEISTVIVFEDENSSPCSFVFDHLDTLLRLTTYAWVADSCSHPDKDSFLVPRESKLSFLKSPAFSAAVLGKVLKEGECTFICCQGGSRFQQLISFCLIWRLNHQGGGAGCHPDYIFREQACLSCTVIQGRQRYRKEKNATHRALVIMCN